MKERCHICGKEGNKLDIFPYGGKDVWLCKECQDQLIKLIADAKKNKGFAWGKPLKHGTMTGYITHKCKCEACSKAYSEYRKQKKEE